MDIKALQTRLRDFAAARDWQPYHSPKNLAMALMVEAAELLELFQWLTTAESRTLTRDAADKERVADEIADVMLYLLPLADHTGVDVEDAVVCKLRKNEQKHPAKHPDKVAPGPKGHLLIDWENVQPRGEELRKLVPEGTDVWLFHNPKQKVDASSHSLAYGASKVTLIPRPDVSTKNALDFQLSYYIGYISARQPQERFVVVSNDTGYDPMLEHARELGFDAQRCEFRRPPPAATPPATPKTKPKKEPKVKAPVHSKPAPQPVPPIDPSAAQIAWRAIVRLRELPVGSRPANLELFVESLIGEPVLDKPELALRASQLLRSRPLGLARAMDAETAVNMPTPSARPSPQPAPPVAPVKPADASAQASHQQTKKAVSPSATKNAAAIPAKPAMAKPVPKPTAAQVAQAVLASLKKMPKNKPTRRAGLLKFIETHAAKAADPKAMAQQVCTLLEARREVAPSPDGQRVVYPKIQAKIASSA